MSNATRKIRRNRRTMAEGGTWRDGKAKPEAIDPRLRRLPGELVTKDLADEAKVHTLDEDHIVAALTDEYAHRSQQEIDGTPETAKGAVEKLGAGPGVRKPLSQIEIDVVRFRVLSVLTGNMANAAANGDPYDPEHVWHLWFPSDNVNEYELRDGNPPPDVERPRHLRNYNLALCVLDWPQSMTDMLNARGIKAPDFRSMFAQIQREADAAREVESGIVLL